mgnify:CR=1 FL=1
MLFPISKCEGYGIAGSLAAMSVVETTVPCGTDEMGYRSGSAVVSDLILSNISQDGDNIRQVLNVARDLRVTAINAEQPGNWRVQRAPRLKKKSSSGYIAPCNVEAMYVSVGRVTIFLLGDPLRHNTALDNHDFMNLFGNITINVIYAVDQQEIFFLRIH